MSRKNLVLSLAALAIGFMLSLAPASAGCGIHQGGECGRDAIFRPGEPRWGSSIRSYVDRNQYHRGGRVHRGGHAHRGGHGHAGRSYGGTRSSAASFHQRTITRSSFVVPTGTIAVYRGTCMRSRITGQVIC